MPITDAQREHAARALCRKAGYLEDTVFDGQPAWMWYLDHVDAVLEAVLPLDQMTNADQMTDTHSP
jgi:hypothetical protein